MESTEIMIRSDLNGRLVQALGADLRPVRRLAPPSLRVLTWLTTSRRGRARACDGL